ncbi:MBG domain-containing protein, partial [Treponema sp. R6D11]
MEPIKNSLLITSRRIGAKVLSLLLCLAIFGTILPNNITLPKAEAATAGFGQTLAWNNGFTAPSSGVVARMRLQNATNGIRSGSTHTLPTGSKWSKNGTTWNTTAISSQTDIKNDPNCTLYIFTPITGFSDLGTSSLLPDVEADVDVSMDPSITTAPNYFLSNYAYGCSYIRSIGVPNTSGITTINNDFMRGYALSVGLNAYNNSGHPPLIGTGTVYDYSYPLAAPNMNPTISSVGNNFMKYYAMNMVTCLSSLGVPDTSHLTSVGNNFMEGYAVGNDLPSVPVFTSLKTAGDNFMKSYFGNFGPVYVPAPSFPALTSVGTGFMTEYNSPSPNYSLKASKTKSIALPNIPVLTSAGSDFMLYYCYYDNDLEDIYAQYAPSYLATHDINNILVTTNIFNTSLHTATISGVNFSTYQANTPAWQALTASGKTLYLNGIKNTSQVVTLPVNITPNVTVNGTYTYNKTAQIPDVTVSYNGQVFTSADYNISCSSNTNAGTASVTVTMKNGYTGSKTVNFTIGKKPLNIVPKSNQFKTKTYGAADPTLTVTFANCDVIGVCSGDTASPSITSQTVSGTAGPSRPAGGYSLTITGSITSTNYYVENTITNNFLTVNKAPLTITAYNAERYVGELSFVPTYYFSGFIDGENWDDAAVTDGRTVSFSYTPQLNFPLVKGTYSIIPSGVDFVNYEENFVSGTLSVITMASFTTTPQATSHTYNGQNQTLVSAGASSTGTPYYCYKKSTDSTYSAWSTSIPAVTNAGAYDVKFKVVKNSNTDRDSVETAVTTNIWKKDIYITLTAANITYSSQDPTISYNTAAATGFVGGDTYASTFSGTIVTFIDGATYSSGKRPVGTYYLNGYGATANNYITNFAGSFTVYPKAITPTVSVTSSYIATGSAITPASKYVIVKDGNTVLTQGTDYTYVASNNTAPGNATVTVTLTGNYSGGGTATFKIIDEDIYSYKKGVIATIKVDSNAILPANKPMVKGSMWSTDNMIWTTNDLTNSDVYSKRNSYIYIFTPEDRMDASTDAVLPNIASTVTIDVDPTITNAGSNFLAYYAASCYNITSLEIPNTENIASVGTNFMKNFASLCSGLNFLTTSASPAWFATHDVDFSVPSSRLGYIKLHIDKTDSESDSEYRAKYYAWLALEDQYRTLHINYIRSPYNIIPTTSLGAVAITKTPIAASDLVYNRSNQDLLSELAESDNYGIIQYAVVASGTACPAKDSSLWSAEIPTAINAGNYDVWFYSKAPHGGFTDSVAQKVGPINIAKKSVTPNVRVNASYIKTGSPIIPADEVIIVQDMNDVLSVNDYNRSATNNTNAGTATLTITLKGNYQGSATSSFEIYNTSIFEKAQGVIANIIIANDATLDDNKSMTYGCLWSTDQKIWKSTDITPANIAQYAGGTIYVYTPSGVYNSTGSILPNIKSSVTITIDPSITTVGDNFMRNFALNCYNITYLGVPNTSNITSVGTHFMSCYAYGCEGIRTFNIIKLDSLQSAGSEFMLGSLTGVDLLLSLNAYDSYPGWFANHNVSFGISENLLGTLKFNLYNTDANVNQTHEARYLSWLNLTQTNKTLWLNFIRNPFNVIADLGQCSLSSLSPRTQEFTRSELSLLSYQPTTSLNGQVLYSVVPHNAAPPSKSITSLWSENIPKRTEIGTYDVYYYAKATNGATTDSVTKMVASTITPKVLSAIDIEFLTKYVYQGQAIEVSSIDFIARDVNYVMNYWVDFSFTVSNNASAGTAQIDFTFTGNYTGSASKTFQIYDDIYSYEPGAIAEISIKNSSGVTLSGITNKSGTLNKKSLISLDQSKWYPSTSISYANVSNSTIYIYTPLSGFENDASAYVFGDYYANQVSITIDPSITSVGDNFMSNYIWSSNAIVFKTQIDLSNITTAGDNFMREFVTGGYHPYPAPYLPNLTTVGDNCLYNFTCGNVPDSYPNFPSLVTAGDNFMYKYFASGQYGDNYKFIVETISDFPCLTSVGDNFLSLAYDFGEAYYSFMKYDTLKLPDFPSLISAGNNFMSKLAGPANCFQKFNTVISPRFPNLTSVGSEFMAFNSFDLTFYSGSITSRQNIVLPYLPSLITKGPQFMQNYASYSNFETYDGPECFEDFDVDLGNVDGGTSYQYKRTYPSIKIHKNQGETDSEYEAKCLAWLDLIETDRTLWLNFIRDPKAVIAADGNVGALQPIDVTPAIPNSNLVFNNTYQSLLDTLPVPDGGVVMYSITKGDAPAPEKDHNYLNYREDHRSPWSLQEPVAFDAGTYTVHYYQDGPSGLYGNSEIFHTNPITIAPKVITPTVDIEPICYTGDEIIPRVYIDQTDFNTYNKEMLVKDGNVILGENINKRLDAIPDGAYGYRTNAPEYGDAAYYQTRDFSMENFEDNIAPGIASFDLVLEGNYSGTSRVTFEILGRAEYCYRIYGPGIFTTVHIDEKADVSHPAVGNQYSNNLSVDARHNVYASNNFHKPLNKGLSASGVLGDSNAAVNSNGIAYSSFSSTELQKLKGKELYIYSKLTPGDLSDMNTTPNIDSTVEFEIDPSITTLGNDFMKQYLYNNRGVKSAKLPDLSNVTSVGDGFLSEFSMHLENIEFGDMSNIQTAGSNFMYKVLGNYYDYCNIEEFPSINLSSLASVGDGFMFNSLYNIRSVKTIGAPHLPNLKTAGENFMSNYGRDCYAMESLELPTLPADFQTTGSIGINASAGRKLAELKVRGEPGYWAAHDVSIEVPLYRETFIKLFVERDTGELDGAYESRCEEWDELTNSGRTLWLNYIRHPHFVTNDIPREPASFTAFEHFGPGALTTINMLDNESSYYEIMRSKNYLSSHNVYPFYSVDEIHWYSYYAFYWQDYINEKFNEAILESDKLYIYYPESSLSAYNTVAYYTPNISSDDVVIELDPRITTVGSNFMSGFAMNCTEITSITGPDTSNITSAGSNFMYTFASGCQNLTSLTIPTINFPLTDTVYDKGNYIPGNIGDFMSNYAYGCSSLTEFVTDSAPGAFAQRDIAFRVPASCEGKLSLNLIRKSGETNAEYSAKREAWEALTVGQNDYTGRTLWLNRIRHAYFIQDDGQMALENAPEIYDMYGSGVIVTMHIADDAAIPLGVPYSGGSTYINYSIDGIVWHSSPSTLSTEENQTDMRGRDLYFHYPLLDEVYVFLSLPNIKADVEVEIDSRISDVGDYFLYYLAKNKTNFTSLGVPDLSNVTTIGDWFMSNYADNATGLEELPVPDLSNVTTLTAEGFMNNYASGTNIETLGAPDLSSLQTLVGQCHTFMQYYAQNCPNLTSLGIPVLPDIEVPPSFSINSYLRNFNVYRLYCYGGNNPNLTELTSTGDPGYFATHAFSFGVPAEKEFVMTFKAIKNDGETKGEYEARCELWEAQMKKNKTLWQNYIRHPYWMEKDGEDETENKFPPELFEYYGSGVVATMHIADDAVYEGINGLSARKDVLYSTDPLGAGQLFNWGRTMPDIEDIRGGELYVYTPINTQATGIALPNIKADVELEIDPSVTTIKGAFLADYAKGCYNLTSLGVPDLSNVTSIERLTNADDDSRDYDDWDYDLGSIRFMNNFADGCFNIKSLGLPDLSNISNINFGYSSSQFMFRYANHCYNLETLKASGTPGYYADHELIFEIPEAREGIVKLCVPEEHENEWRGILSPGLPGYDIGTLRFNRIIKQSDIITDDSYEFVVDPGIVATMYIDDNASFAEWWDYNEYYLPRFSKMRGYAQWSTDMINWSAAPLLVSQEHELQGNTLYIGIPREFATITPENNRGDSAGYYFGYGSNIAAEIRLSGIPNIKADVDIWLDPEITVVGPGFMNGFALNCYDIKSLGMPDTSNITSICKGFMASFAENCRKLQSLEAPDLSGVTGYTPIDAIFEQRGFMEGFAKNCSRLT